MKTTSKTWVEQKIADAADIAALDSLYAAPTTKEAAIDWAQARRVSILSRADFLRNDWAPRCRKTQRCSALIEAMRLEQEAAALALLCG